MSVKAASVGPLVFVPTMLTQPVAAQEVAAALVDAAEAGPRFRHEPGRLLFGNSPRPGQGPSSLLL